MVLRQSVWVGVFGVLLAGPAVFALAAAAGSAGARVVLHPLVLAGAGGVTLVTAVLSGLVALRGVRRIEPMSLLR
jgi:putative ABC transport system permease protein